MKTCRGPSRAFGRGEISYRHAEIIANTAEGVEIDEDKLVEKAKRQPVDVFARTARRHAQDRSEDDGMSRLKRQRRNRKAWLRVDPRSGMTVVHAEFDPITGERVKAALGNKTNQLWREEDSNNRPSTRQRMADALADLICEPGKDESGDEKKSKRRETVLFLIADYDIGLQKLRNARLGDGTPIPVEAFRELACRARIVPSIFDTRGQPLWVGLGRRLATPAQRMALIARDQGCVGCHADPSWCQAHHVIPWQAKGPTDIDNMVLLCSRCHHRVHDEDWEVLQAPSGKYTLHPPPRNGRRALPMRPITSRRRRRRSTTRLLR